jgi:long-chain fatty acid transport protein
MKKITFGALVLALFLLPAGLFAGSLDYLTNQSARWLMTPTRNAATDAADIVNYNPAGTVFLPLGWNIDVSNQMLFKFYSNDVKLTPDSANPALAPFAYDKTVKQDLPTWFLPNLYVAYNFGNAGPGKLAIYGQGGVTAGGGTLAWDDGTAGTVYALSLLGIAASAGPVESQELEASSVYYGVALGGAYSLFEDMLSVSLGGRLVMPKRSLSVKAAYLTGDTVKADFDYDAYGFTPIIGVNVRPIRELTLSLRYEAQTRLKFEYDGAITSVNPYIKGTADTLFGAVGLADGAKFNLDLPHLIALGVNYDITKELTLSLSSNIYLLSLADLNGVEDDLGTGYEIGLGATYMIMENLKLGAGFLYTEAGAKDSYFENNILNASANPFLDSIAFGLGGTYYFDNGLDVTLSFLYCHYLPVDGKKSGDLPTPLHAFDMNNSYKKNFFEIGIGVGYKY